MSEERMKVFSQDEIVYSAFARCRCGAGLAYISDRDERVKTTGNSWVCGRLLTEDVNISVKKQSQDPWIGGILEEENGTEHDTPRLFAFYEIKSERQPSANGMTTRPTV